jgi:uncharacterized protein YjiS (DUF1127 family)
MHASRAWLSKCFGAYAAVQHDYIALRQDRERPAAMTPRWTRRKDGGRPMSAPLAKSDFIFKLATSQSYIDGDYDPTPLPAAQPAPRSLLRRIGDGLAFAAEGVKTWAGKQATLSEMDTMSDRELADIGLNRGDVGRVFDPAFVADHARGRATY